MTLDSTADFDAIVASMVDEATAKRESYVSRLSTFDEEAIAQAHSEYAARHDAALERLRVARELGDEAAEADALLEAKFENFIFAQAFIYLAAAGDLLVDAATRIAERVAEEGDKVPTVGPAFDPLPSDPAERQEATDLRTEIEDEIDAAATHAFSASFLIAAAFGAAALIPISIRRGGGVEL